jgi:hypothetical protein
MTMKIYHYTTKAAAKKIMRLHAQGYLEFLLCAQPQSGHPDGSYWSKKGPTDLPDKPISRYFGTTALPGTAICFELEIDNDWQTGDVRNLKFKLDPITGARGDGGIALYLHKGHKYEPPLGDSDEDISQNECICVPKALLKHVYVVPTGQGSKAPTAQCGGNANYNTIRALFN